MAPAYRHLCAREHQKPLFPAFGFQGGEVWLSMVGEDDKIKAGSRRDLSDFIWVFFSIRKCRVDMIGAYDLIR